MAEQRGVVFVVDDDVSVRESLNELIRTAGLEVRVFASAHQFIAHSRPDAPSCMVLDVELPGLNGLELQSRMKEIDRDVPIIFITGHGDIPMSVRAMKAGAVEFLTKPFPGEELLAAIQRALERSKIARSEEALQPEQIGRRFAVSGERCQGQSLGMLAAAVHAAQRPAAAVRVAPRRYCASGATSRTPANRASR